MDRIFELLTYESLGFLLLAIVAGYGWLQIADMGPKIVTSLLLLLALTGLWSSLLEPRWLTTQKHSVELGFSSKIVFIADPHLGIYKGKPFIHRVVQRINQIQPDVVIIGGDLVYKPEADKLIQLFSPLTQLEAPTYAVLGNHDVGIPGVDLRTEVTKALEKNDVEMLQNEVVNLSEFQLVGLGSRWAGRDKTSVLEQFNSKENVVTVAHNPDSLTDFPAHKSDLNLFGHTHGGQLKIPILYKQVIPTEGDFDEGFYGGEKGLSFVTSGLGEVGLPMRLFNPPSIEVFEVSKTNSNKNRVNIPKTGYKIDSFSFINHTYR
jgi:hypothetical protein